MAETRTRTKKADMPFAVNFVDGDGKDHAKPAINAASVVVTDKAGNKVTVDLNNLSGEVARQLASDSISRAIKIGVMKGFDPSKDNALILTNEIVARILDGKLYTRTGEGKKAGAKGGVRGRTFDIDLWVSVIERVAKLSGKPATPEKLEAAKAKLLAFTSAEREEWKKRQMKNAVFELGKKQIDAEKAKAKAKEVKNEDYDVFA